MVSGSLGPVRLFSSIEPARWARADEQAIGRGSDAGLDVSDTTERSSSAPALARLDPRSFASLASAGQASIASTPLSTQALVPPPGTPARHDAPVVVVHGTMVDASKVIGNEEPILNDGHPVDIQTYQSIKEGQPLQESGQLLSTRINEDRIEIARANVSRLKALGGDLPAIASDLGIDGTLYGSDDGSATRLAGLVPSLVSRIDAVLAQPVDTLKASFSLKMRRIEEALVGEVSRTGFAANTADVRTRDALRCKAAAELMDAIAPKAVLVGHSMGGFVSYVVAMNPSDEKSQGSPFAYDAGNGISTIIAVSSPIKSGTSNPLPPGLESYGYDTLDKTVLAPFESTPQGQLIMANPILDGWWQVEKSLTRAAMGAAANASTVLTDPLTFAMKPGVAQISEGSDFIHKYVEGRKVPREMTAFSFTNRDDGIAEADHSLLDERQANAFNVDVRVALPPDLLAKPGTTPATLTHLMMGRFMYAHGAQCKEKVFQNPVLLPKVLDGANYDGVRWLGLSTLQEMVDEDPTLLVQPRMAGVRAAVERVAAEKMPFRDAPSALARKILDKAPKGATPA